ncbi:MAG TPA: cyanophycin synthetase, partial [Flavobacterium sp.]|nr:cyanophycin synthetase [Flavobacterium sp.]
MKILSKKVLRGPNVWSNYRQNLIQMRMDLEDMENYPTDKIPGFRERIEELLPNMIEHECSEMKRGGFFIRVERGTWLGHVLEHIALEIQSLAGMKTGFGRTRGTSTKGIYNIVFTYEVEEAGLYAAEAAFRIVKALVAGEQYDLETDLVELRKLKSQFGLGPSTKSIVDEAVKRGIPYLRQGNDST